MTKQFTKVTKAEFKEFVSAYPRPLDRDIDQRGEPPCISYNDFSLGDWPESVVARYLAFGFNEDGTDSADIWGGVPGDYAIAARAGAKP